MVWGQDAQASNWAMYWLLQERQRRPGIGVARGGATVASTVASTGEERSFDRQGSLEDGGRDTVEVEVTT